MFHLAAVVSKVTGKYLFYKDYWAKYQDRDPFFNFFTAYIPFVARENENTYKLIHWDKLRIAFGNFNEIIMILAATLDTSDKLIETYLIRAYEMLFNIYGDLSNGELIPEKIAEFSQGLELMIRVSATNEDLKQLDHTVEERHGVTPASEEVNRRTTQHSEQATKLLEQFAVEMLDGTITKYRLFLTAAVRVKEAIHYQVIVDFSPYPHPPVFDLPQVLHNILGDAGEALETIRGWDPIHPPNWMEVVQELEQKVYKSETHLIEPIIEEPASPVKGKGFAKNLKMPTRKEPRGIPYPQTQPQPPPNAHKMPETKEVPFLASIPPEIEKKRKKEKKKEISCPNCGFIFKSKDDKTCQLCGSPRPE
ncbi:MAG: hypothetical protein HWN66_16980 [Candidatus Helarchaeota archaeon]|nr:hypothetical protein [Candidatus Helarchaeota archaeon]